MTTTLATINQKKFDLVPIADEPGSYGHSPEYIDNEINQMKKSFWEKRGGNEISIQQYEDMIQTKRDLISALRDSDHPNLILIDQAKNDIIRIQRTINQVQQFNEELLSRRNDLEDYTISQADFVFKVQKIIEDQVDLYENFEIIQYFPGIIEKRLKREFPKPDWDEMEERQRKLDNIDVLQMEGNQKEIEKSIRRLKGNYEREMCKYEYKMNDIVKHIPTHPLYRQFAFMVHQQFDNAKELTKPLELLLPKLDISNKSHENLLEKEIGGFFSTVKSHLIEQTYHELNIFPDNSNGLLSLEEYADKMIETIYKTTVKTVQDPNFMNLMLGARNLMMFNLIKTFQNKYHVDYGLKFEGLRLDEGNRKILLEFINPAPVVEEIEEVEDDDAGADFADEVKVKPAQQKALPQPIIDEDEEADAGADFADEGSLPRDPAKTIDDFIKSLPGNEWELGTLLEQYNEFFGTSYSSESFRQNKDVKSRFRSLGKRSIGGGKKATYYGIKQ